MFRFSAPERRVTLGGRDVVLTPREADVLAYLLERPGEVVPIRTLEREVWKFTPGVRSQAVPVTLRRLRSKLGPDAATVLESVRGTGWRAVRGLPSPSHVKVPDFGTSYFQRPAETAAIESLPSCRSR